MNFIFQFESYAKLSREVSSRRAPSSKGSVGAGGEGGVTAVAEDLEDGRIRVGKIFFEPDQLLGKGCDGTFVFRSVLRSAAYKGEKNCVDTGPKHWADYLVRNKLVTLIEVHLI